MSKYSFVGTGAFGCVIKPGYVCHSYQEEKFKKSQTISKLFLSREEWEKEIKIQIMVQDEIDKDSKFTVKMLDSCEKPGSISKEVSNINKCKQTFNETKQIFQIVYEFGGVDLARLTIDTYPEITAKLNIVKVLVSLFNVLQGIQKMISLDYMHRDIKIDNILYDINSNKSSLIDFGFCVKRKDTYDNLAFFFENESEFQHKFYPVEYNLMFHAYINKNKLTKEEAKKLNFYKACLDIVPLIDKINGRANIPDNYKKKVMEVKATLFEYLEKCNDILDFFKDAYKEKLKPTKTDIDYYLSVLSNKNSVNKIDIRYKIDVYMFGMSLMYFVILALLNLKEDNGIFKIPLNLFNLILKMIDTNPFTRCSIEEAIAEYKQIFSL